MRSKTHMSLNIDLRRTERDAQKVHLLAMENRRRVGKGEEPLDALEEDSDDNVAMNDEALEVTVEAEEDGKDKERDPLLTEASHILIDALPYFLLDRLARRP
jgi:carboxyl-terminal processing protease